MKTVKGVTKEGVRYLAMNTLNGMVQIIVSESKSNAIKKARDYFGKGSSLYVVRDTLSTR